MNEYFVYFYFIAVFDLLVYTNRKNIENEDYAINNVWIDSDAKSIPLEKCEIVKLRALSTGAHHVDSTVTYRLPSLR